MGNNMANEISIYDLGKPNEAIQLAEVLGKFIKERHLTTNIQGKQYVNVEGWQFALSQMGIVPMLVSLDNLTTETELKYRADVDLIRLSDGSKVGRGIAICSNKERTKKSFDEYAIASMAQTRAEGKAARMLLSWLMKAAGFETTPTEEIIDTEEADEVTDEGRDFLLALLASSTYDPTIKDKMLSRINSITLKADYEKAKAKLLDAQPDPITHGVPNGSFNSTTDITKHIRKLAK
jgi:hypothetical protein